jgi:O-antigen biosynthesis protein
MTRYYCTYFDRHYLARGLALIESLQRQESNTFVMYVVCMDELTRLALDRLAIPQVRTIPLHEIERHDDRLSSIRPTRSLVEYYWTLTPTVILRILERHRDIDLLTYVDADLYFFSSPQPLFDELGSGSVLIHEHRFSPRQGHLAEHNGRYNVGLLSFRRDANGLTALRWWRERCLEWCFARYEQGRWAIRCT